MPRSFSIRSGAAVKCEIARLVRQRYINANIAAAIRPVTRFISIACCQRGMVGFIFTVIALSSEGLSTGNPGEATLSSGRKTSVWRGEFLRE